MSNKWFLTKVIIESVPTQFSPWTRVTVTGVELPKANTGFQRKGTTTINGSACMNCFLCILIVAGTTDCHALD
jgi:hypothetical protein